MSGRSQRHMQEIHDLDSVGVERPRFTGALANQTSTRNVADSYNVGALADVGYPTGTFSASGLPTGMSINASTGNITGTPTVSATYRVKVRVANAYGGDTRDLTWVVSG